MPPSFMPTVLCLTSLHLGILWAAKCGHSRAWAGTTLAGDSEQQSKVLHGAGERGRETGGRAKEEKKKEKEKRKGEKKRLSDSWHELESRTRERFKNKASTYSFFLAYRHLGTGGGCVRCYSILVAHIYSLWFARVGGCLDSPPNDNCNKISKRICRIDHRRLRVLGIARELSPSSFSLVLISL